MLYGNNSEIKIKLRENIMKKLISIITVLAMVMSFSACGNRETSIKEENQPQIESSQPQSSDSSTVSTIDKLPTIEECKAKIMETFPSATITNISTDDVNKNNDKIYSFNLVEGFNVQFALSKDNSVKQSSNTLVTKVSTKEELTNSIAISLNAIYAFIDAHENNTFTEQDLVNKFTQNVKQDDSGDMTLDDVSMGDFVIGGFVSNISGVASIAFWCKRTTIPF